MNSQPRFRTPGDFDCPMLLDLLSDAGKNWLAHDGLWFQEVEQQFGIEKAIELDKAAWAKFTVIEAKRIMKRLDLQPGGGIPALMEALGFRLYAYINRQEIRQLAQDRCMLTMQTCRVQDARQRRGLPDFPCNEVGIVEYSGFAETIDPRITTVCRFCPPDETPKDAWCSWEFVLRSK